MSALEQLQSFETPKPEVERVPVWKLRVKEHGKLLCYPGIDVASFPSRLKQLKKLGVKELILEGSSKVGKFGVLGKGCVSIVVKAKLAGGPDEVALKVRRVDANRASMKRDYELQMFVNSFGVGPRAISATEDFFAMEYIDSIKLGKWFRELKTRASRKYARKLVRSILSNCYLLDIHGLDHGELSNPSKHVLIRNNDLEVKTVVIDYESASTSRRVANLTAATQFLLLESAQSAKLRKVLGLRANINRLRSQSSRLVTLLRSYKEHPSGEAFEKLMSYLRC
jgi:putative serine/threonine protein kinase